MKKFILSILILGAAICSAGETTLTQTHEGSGQTLAGAYATAKKDAPPNETIIRQEIRKEGLEYTVKITTQQKIITK